MKNWSGNQRWNPKQLLQPSTTDEIISIVKNAIDCNSKIRVYGSKHSFTEVNNTDDICVNLDNFQGIIEVDTDKSLVTVKAGTKLFLLNKLLAEQNLALENMGDVDVQSIAGAIATGTHGTGVYFGNISTQVVAVKFINGLGEEVYCSKYENSKLFKCMQISLGALGIVTEITLNCVPNYKLKCDKYSEKLSEVLANIVDYNANNRNFEFYWFPYTDTVQTKYSNITNYQSDKSNFFNFFNDYFIENYMLSIVCKFAKIFPKLNIGISKISANFLTSSTKIKQSKDVYATPRLVKFNEMEYNIPLEAYKDAMKDVIKMVNSKKFNIHFPIENRFVKQDDIYLSPAYKRDSAYIACHVYKGKEYKAYFKALEEIFTAYDGRPHWGKIHYKKSDYLVLKYPMFDEFNNQRTQQDPHQIFLNDYLKSILT